MGEGWGEGGLCAAGPSPTGGEGSGRPLSRQGRGEGSDPPRQPHHEAGAFARGADHADGAAVQGAQFAHQGEAEAGALVLPRQRGIELQEGLEQAAQVGFLDADAVVADGDLDELREVARRQRQHARRHAFGRLDPDVLARNAAGDDAHLAAVGGELHRIG